MKRLGNYMGTYSGRRFWPTDPKCGDFYIQDIAHALSLVNRYAGHSKWPYSVAQHSVICARQAIKIAPDQALAVLLHDASEAYIQDLVRPVKGDVTGYEVLEDRLMAKIAAQYSFKYPFDPIVKVIDNQILVTEAPVLMRAPDGIHWWLKHEYPPPIDGLLIEPWVAQYAEDEFLRMAYMLIDANNVNNVGQMTNGDMSHVVFS